MALRCRQRYSRRAYPRGPQKERLPKALICSTVTTVTRFTSSGTISLVATELTMEVLRKMVMIQFARTGTAVIMAMAVAGFSWVVLARSELLADDPKAARPKPAASPPHAGKPGTGSLGVFLSRGGPQRTGSISSTRVLEHPAVQWSFSTKGEPGAPLLADGVIYVGDRSETFYAVNLSDGTVLWQTEGLGHVYFSPAKCGETLYVNSNKGLTALSQSDGRVRWQCKVEGDLTESSPLIVKDRIIVADTSGTMYAVDLNGKIIWEHDMLDDEQVQLKRAELEHMKRQLLRGGGQVARPTTAASDGTTIFQPIFDESRVLLAIDLEAGKRRWSFHAKGMSYGGPAVTDDRVFFGTQGDNEFYCLDKRRKTVSLDLPGPISDRGGAGLSEWLGLLRLVRRPVLSSERRDGQGDLEVSNTQVPRSEYRHLLRAGVYGRRSLVRLVRRLSLLPGHR